MGYLFVVSGPSAVGKTTVVSRVLEQSSFLNRVVTCTTRDMRKGESDGVDYIFLPKEEFKRKIENNEFAEFSVVYDNYYGVLLKSIRDSMKEYVASILTISGEGYLKIKDVIGEGVVGIFIKPPSLKELEARIRGRGSEDEKTIKKRLEAAKSDMSFANKYDFIVENREIWRSTESVLKIIDKTLNENS